MKKQIHYKQQELNININLLHSALKKSLTDQTCGVERLTPAFFYGRALELRAELEQYELTIEQTTYYDKLDIDNLLIKAKEKHGSVEESRATELNIEREADETHAISMSMVMNGSRTLREHELLYGGNASEGMPDAEEQKQEKLTHLESMDQVVRGLRSYDDHQREFGRG